MTEIYFLRHGQTLMNNAMVLQGRSNLPLNEKGISQADTVGKWFAEQNIKFTRVYSSPLIRAVQTADRVAQNCSKTIDERLIEMDYGPYEGADLNAPPKELLLFFRDFVHQKEPDGMESLDSVVSRLGEFLEELRKNEPGGAVLISTHAIAMKGALEYLTPESKGSYWGTNIGNCAVYRTILRNGVYSIPIQLY